MSSNKKVKLPVNKLLVGFMIDLELSWTKHPFLFSKFKISDHSEILIIKQLGLTEVTVFPDQSDRDVAHKTQSEKATDETPEPKELTETKWQQKKANIKNADSYRSKRSSVAKKYKQQAKLVRKLTSELKTEPANAIRDVTGLVDIMTSDFENKDGLLTNLVNLGAGQHNMYNHVINVTILSLSLAASRGIEGDRLKMLARGALLHDVGKVELPGPVINKTTPLNKAEMGVFRQHAPVGRKLCELVEGMPQEVLKIIELHHECMDGSGYPHQFKEDKIPELTRIVAIANTYDNLCNPADVNKALTPKIALATMYSKYKDKLDHQLVQTFISTLGIYPPGSVVKLNDNSLGLVVTVDPKDMLNPEVLLYNPDIPRLQALIIDLKEHKDLTIVGVLKPSEYPSRVYEYLGIEERLGYMSSIRS